MCWWERTLHGVFHLLHNYFCFTFCVYSRVPSSRDTKCVLQPLYSLWWPTFHFSGVAVEKSHQSECSRAIWPSKSWPFLERCIKSLLVTYSTVCPHTTSHWTHSSWNVCERDNNALMPIMVLRPVKERSGVCFRKVKVIQLLRNVLRRNCHK